MNVCFYVCLCAACNHAQTQLDLFIGFKILRTYSFFFNNHEFISYSKCRRVSMCKLLSVLMRRPCIYLHFFFFSFFFPFSSDFLNTMYTSQYYLQCNDVLPSLFPDFSSSTLSFRSPSHLSLEFRVFISLINFYFCVFIITLLSPSPSYLACKNSQSLRSRSSPFFPLSLGASPLLSTPASTSYPHPFPLHTVPLPYPIILPSSTIPRPSIYPGPRPDFLPYPYPRPHPHPHSLSPSHPASLSPWS